MEEVLNSIKRRYIHEKSIYTWCGIALVAVNPYQEQDIYGDQAVETYHSASHSVYLQLDPHIYAVTEDAYSKLERTLRNQSIIVSGESGAGKTSSAKHALRYLASIASSKSKIRVENRVLASNPIMEAIGNASTVRNDNSSRFGKYIQIFFDRQNRKIVGGSMRTYLLEKSRVVKLQPGERNFHIFYQMLNYARENGQALAHLKLNDESQQFSILGEEPGHNTKSSSSSAGDEELKHDLSRFNEALQTLGIDESRVDVIYRIIAGILHGGNIRFSEDANSGDNLESCTIDESACLDICCELLGFNKQETVSCLTSRLLKTGSREVITRKLTKEQAEYTRDAMLKYIYEHLFTWLVGLINLSLETKELKESQESGASVVPKSPSAKKTILDLPLQPHFIGVLDIYGFENFKTNSFEQFCINYANEVLQQQYNQHVFKLEQEEYIREGIDWTFIEYSDNQPVIDVIEMKPIGILNLLDEECRMPKGTDNSWCAKLYEHLLPQPGKRNENNNNSHLVEGVFKRPKMNYQSSFCVCHYAEEVVYDVATFLEKNRDTICEELSQLIRSSTAISYIFNDPTIAPEAGSLPQQLNNSLLLDGSSLLLTPPNSALKSNRQTSGRPGRVATVGHQFRGSLAALIKTLNDTEPHYIRCIKPNDEKKAFVFNEERAVQQLKACGVYETIRISNNGFPSRWIYKDFAKRYCVLIYGTPAFEKLSSSSSSSSSPPEEGAPQQVMERSSKSARFLRHFTSADVRPICTAICNIAYQDTVYKHIRTKEEEEYLGKLIERHGNKPSAIYQFGKTKIFFRAGQVGYLERVRSQKLRDYAIAIQRQVRGWLARKEFARRMEQHLEQLRRAEESLASLQLQQELEQQQQQQLLLLQQQQLPSLTSVEEEEEEEEEVQADRKPESSEATSSEQPETEELTRLASVYLLLVDIIYNSIQPLIIGAVLEYEALDPPVDAFSSLESRSVTPSEQPMDELLKELDKYHDLIVKNQVPEDIAVQAYKQIFYLICAQSLNQLLIRRDLCQFTKAMQVSFNLSCLVQWCRERYPVHWREIVSQLDPITQATKLLQTRKSSEDIATIDEVCNKLTKSQIIKILNMYSSSYEEQITTDFIHELEEHLSTSRSQVCNADLLLDTKKYFRFVDMLETC